MKKTKEKKSKKSRRRVNILEFPAKLVLPIGEFLKSNLKKLEKRKKELEKEDPFSDSRRVLDNASPDTDAEEQFGHARTNAIKEQLDRKIVQTRKALSRIRLGKYGICEVCGKMIDTDRLVIYPEATACIKCESKKQKK